MYIYLAFGITKIGQYYPNSNYAKDEARTRKHRHFGFKNIEIDIYLDCDIGELRLCVVGLKYEGEAHMHKIPMYQNNGWVPYFVLFQSSYESCEGMTLRIAKIPLEWYSVYEPNIFPPTEFESSKQKKN